MFFYKQKICDFLARNGFYCLMLFHLVPFMPFIVFIVVVKLLLDHCKECHVNKLIHLSSVFLQASAKWPNVLCREETDYEKFRKEVPFSTYCESKHLAEQLIEKGVFVREAETF